jgi:tetratricopeptide (TPR) repeat protein
MGFFKSLFKSKAEDPVTEQEKKLQKEFEILKYDGIRAYRLHRYDYAQKCFEEAIKLQDDYETYGQLAQLLVERGNLQGALGPLLHMAKAEPTIALNFITLANVHFMLENYHEMADNAQLAIHLEPNNPQAYYLKGKAAHAMGVEGEAVSLLTKAIELKADYAEALLLRGQVYLSQGQLEEALQDAEAVISSENEVESGLLLRGAVKEVDNQLEEAEADYQQILEIDPFNQQAFINLGKLYCQQQRYADAISLMDDAIEMSPVFAEAYAIRSEAKKLSGDDEGAAKDATAAANLKAASEVTSEVVDPAASIKEIDIMHL